MYSNVVVSSQLLEGIPSAQSQPPSHCVSFIFTAEYRQWQCRKRSYRERGKLVSLQGRYGSKSWLMTELNKLWVFRYVCCILCTIDITFMRVATLLSGASLYLYLPMWWSHCLHTHIRNQWVAYGRKELVRGPQKVLRHFQAEAAVWS